MIYPIGFSIPECKIVSKVPAKEFVYATVVPGKPETYVFNNESDYYKDYQRSVFGHTKCKAGWDCLRHYEILANGCIPWFQDLDKCPSTIMTKFPKRIVLEAMAAFSSSIRSDVHSVNMDMEHYAEILLDYTKRFLTTKAMANYVRCLTKPVDRVLYLSINPRPDYMRCLLLHGFKELLGPECHDSICIPHLYTDFPEALASNLYGKGMTYTRLLDRKKYRNDDYDKTLIEDIEHHRYDLIIYGSVHRGIPYWDIIQKKYNEDEIVFICGEDRHMCEYGTLGKKYNIFIREL